MKKTVLAILLAAALALASCGSSDSSVSDNADDSTSSQTETTQETSSVSQADTQSSQTQGSQETSSVSRDDDQSSQTESTQATSSVSQDDKQSSQKESSATNTEKQSSQTRSTTKATSASKSSQKSSSKTTENSSQAEPKPKILVAYFTPAENGENDAITSSSKTKYQGKDMGNAAVLAKMTADYTGGKLFSIRTVKDYPVDYNDLKDYAKKEQKDGELPELASQINVSDYDTVFVVFPIWWHTMPQAVYSFFDKYDFSGKTIVPISTHDGSVLANTKAKIMEIEPKATIKEGYSVKGKAVGSAKSELESWLKKLGY